MSDLLTCYFNKMTESVNFIRGEAIEAQRGCGGIALLFPELRH